MGPESDTAGGNERRVTGQNDVEASVPVFFRVTQTSTDAAEVGAAVLDSVILVYPNDV